MKYLVLVSAFLLIISPTLVLGQAGGLVPCDGVGEKPCDTKAAIDMVNNLIKYFISLLAAIAVIAFVYAGFLMVTSGGDTSAWQKGKTIFTNVVIGIIIILAAWLIVDTILTMLTNRGGINNWLNFFS